MNPAKKAKVNIRKYSKIKSNSKKNSIFYILSGILILTFILYSESIRNNFINGWDDNNYVTDNYDIINFSLKGFKNLCTGFYVNCYLPLTMLTYVLEFKVFGMNAIAYHTDNLILHIFNIILVFIFIFQLFKNKEIAAITALFFAIHPMHVESVAWVSERKDLLYTLFFLVSLICYLKYVQKSIVHSPQSTFISKNIESSNLQIFKSSNYLISLFLFFLSLLSKSMAVTLPVILILLDWFLKRKLSKKTVYEKIPFFILSILFGIITMISQKAFTVSDNNILYKNIIDRVFMLTFSLSFYIIKIFAPFKLSAIHPFPDKVSGFLPFEYYLSPILIILILYLIVRVVKRNANENQQMTKTLIFGILFFLITISVVLMIIPVGYTLVSERYTYVPYLGFFIIAGSFYNSLKFKAQSLSTKTTKEVKLNIYRTSYIILLTSIIIIFSILTYSRNKVWKDGISLFTDVIEKYPHAAIAYYNRAIVNKSDLNISLADYNQAINLRPDYETAYNNRGFLKISLKDYKGAMDDFNKALTIKPKYEIAYCNRGWLKSILQDNKGAMEDINQALFIDPKYAMAFINRGWVKANTGDNQGAIEDFNRAIYLNSDLALAYRNRAWIRGNMNDFKGAIEDVNKAILFNPEDDLAYNNRGWIKEHTNDYISALEDINKAISLNPNNDMAFFNRGWLKNNMLDYDGAIEDINKAILLNPNFAMAYNLRGLIKFNNGDSYSAIEDYNKAILIMPDNPQAYFNRGNAEIYLKDLPSACKDWNIAMQSGMTEAKNNITKYCNR